MVKVGALSSLPPGAVTEAMAGENPYAVCNVAGELHCLDGVCPHAGGPLGQGTLNDNMLTCPWHGWEYDCRTGVNDFDPDVRVAKFPVKVEDGQIYIVVP